LQGLTLDDLLALPDDELNLNSWPMLTTRRWTRERHESWYYGSATNSPLWQSRVMGEFPNDSESSLFTLASLERAAASPGRANDRSEITIGIDPAGAGADLTVATAFSCGSIIDQAAWAAADPRGEAVAFVKKFGERVRLVRVDTGGLGYNFMLHLRDVLNVPVEGVNFGESPSNERAREHYANRKAELYGELRDLFEKGCVFNLNLECISELSSLRYEQTPQGRIQIESKDSLRKRGIKSPDRADSLALAIPASGSWSAKDFLTMPSKESRTWGSRSSGSGGRCRHGNGPGCPVCQDEREDAANTRGIPSGAVTCKVAGPRSLRGL
jgi:phage terminase large subunit